MRNRIRILFLMLAVTITLGALLFQASAYEPKGLTVDDKKNQELEEIIKDQSEQKAEEEAQTALKLYEDYLSKLEKMKNGGLRTTIFKIRVFAAGEDPHFKFSDVSKELLLLSKKAKNGGSDGDLIDAITSYGRSTFQALEMIGIMLMAMYFIVYTLDMIQAESFTAEQFFKKLIIFAIALFIMMNGTTLFEGIIRVFDTMLIESDFANTAAATGSSAMAKAHSEISQINNVMGLVWKLLEDGLTSLIPILAQAVAIIIVIFVSITRVIEIIVRYAFAPIALAPIAGEGLRSSSIRYLKKFAACCLHGVVIIFILALTGSLHSLLNSVLSSRVFKGFLGNIIIPIMVIAGVFKAGKLSDDIMGV